MSPDKSSKRFQPGLLDHEVDCARIFSPQDSPRGLEFLYDLNRFNIATSRDYQVVSMLMNTDRLPVNGGQQPELKYLANPLP